MTGIANLSIRDLRAKTKAYAAVFGLVVLFFGAPVFASEVCKSEFKTASALPVLGDARLTRVGNSPRYLGHEHLETSNVFSNPEDIREALNGIPPDDVYNGIPGGPRGSFKVGNLIVKFKSQRGGLTVEVHLDESSAAFPSDEELRNLTSNAIHQIFAGHNMTEMATELGNRVILLLRDAESRAERTNQKFIGIIFVVRTEHGQFVTGHVHDSIAAFVYGSADIGNNTVVSRFGTTERIGLYAGHLLQNPDMISYPTGTVVFDMVYHSSPMRRYLGEPRLWFGLEAILEGSARAERE